MWFEPRVTCGSTAPQPNAGRMRTRIRGRPATGRTWRTIVVGRRRLVVDAQEGVEHRLAVDARQAAPHDLCVGVDERAEAAVADQSEVEGAHRP
jgi:hypothetical protein